MRMGETRLDEAALRPGSPLDEALDALRAELAGPDAVVAPLLQRLRHTGRSFAQALAMRLGLPRRGAYVHHRVLPERNALRCARARRRRADPHEGVRFAGGVPTGAKWSSRGAPNTVSCLAGDLPQGY